MTRDIGGPANEGEALHVCHRVLDRRAFLTDASRAAVLILAALGAAPRLLDASPGTALGEIMPVAVRARTVIYPVPDADGAVVDVGNRVLLIRAAGRAYAFSLECPHRGAVLQWRSGQGQVVCPKHKAQFSAAGVYESGRRTRSLDRFALRREGATLVVDLATLVQSDTDPAGWTNAAVVL